MFIVCVFLCVCVFFFVFFFFFWGGGGGSVIFLETQIVCSLKNQLNEAVLKCN